MAFDPNARLDAFYADIEILEKEFIRNIQRLTRTGNISELELSRFLTQYDFFTMLRDMGYEGTVNGFMNDWNGQILRLLNLSTKGQVDLVARVDISSLEKVRQLELERLLGRGAAYAGEVRIELLKALMTGADLQTIQRQVLPRIQQDMKFYPGWFGAMLNTAYSEYNAAGLQMLTAPYPEVRFILRGPVDAHTRPACIQAMKTQKELMSDPKNDQYRLGFTERDINKLGIFNYTDKKGKIHLYTMEKRGGHNCRHWLEANPDTFPSED